MTWHFSCHIICHEIWQLSCWLNKPPCALSHTLCFIWTLNPWMVIIMDFSPWVVSAKKLKSSYIVRFFGSQTYHVNRSFVMCKYAMNMHIIFLRYYKNIWFTYLTSKSTSIHINWILKWGQFFCILVYSGKTPLSGLLETRRCLLVWVREPKR